MELGKNLSEIGKLVVFSVVGDFCESKEVFAAVNLPIDIGRMLFHQIRDQPFELFKAGFDLWVTIVILSDKAYQQIAYPV